MQSISSSSTLAVASRQHPSTCWSPIYASIVPWRNRARSGAQQTLVVRAPAWRLSYHHHVLSINNIGSHYYNLSTFHRVHLNNQSTPFHAYSFLINMLNHCRSWHKECSYIIQSSSKILLQSIQIIMPPKLNKHDWINKDGAKFLWPSDLVHSLSSRTKRLQKKVHCSLCRLSNARTKPATCKVVGRKP